MANNKEKIQTPCCAVLGHVDVGKTALLDRMRRTVTDEASGITQQIGTTLYSRSRLEKLIGDKLKKQFNSDALLMIDTPGHECFDMIRYVALKVVDVVILMIDVLKDLEKQTISVISMLQEHNVPFIICLNKIDRIYGWKNVKPIADPVLETDMLNINSVLKRIDSDTKTRFDNYIDKIKNKLYEFDIISELYYKNDNPKKIVSIVPISAKTGEGIPDLIMLISVMAERRYLTDDLIDKNIDALILGCTHYPILKKEIKKLIPKNIKIISQEEIIPNKLKGYLKKHSEISGNLSKKRKMSILTTSKTANMKSKVVSLL